MREGTVSERFICRCGHPGLGCYCPTSAYTPPVKPAPATDPRVDTGDRPVADRLREIREAHVDCRDDGCEVIELLDLLDLDLTAATQTAPSLPALLTECPHFLGGVYHDGYDEDCHGTGKVLTPAGEQVAELVEWVRRA